MIQQRNDTQEILEAMAHPIDLSLLQQPRAP